MHVVFLNLIVQQFSLYIISLLKTKTLVIVNEEFLLDQWIERIIEFLPTAQIGKIQGKTIDMEGKDRFLLISINDFASSSFPYQTYSLDICTPNIIRHTTLTFCSICLLS